MSIIAQTSKVCPNIHKFSAWLSADRTKSIGVNSLSVVIPTYNRFDTLKAVLDAFKRQTLSPGLFEVILVDSMSDDGTEQMVKRFDPKFHFRYIRQENKGRSGARNRGIQEAKGEYICFIDSDIVPEGNFLEEHLKFHQEHSNAAAIGWESRIDKLSDLDEAGSNPKRFRIHRPKSKRLTWLYFLTGNLSVPRKKLLDVGMFDESFQGYGYEDLELGYRLQKSGVEFYYLPKALNYHVHPRSLGEQVNVMRMAGRNAVKFYRKHGDWRIRWLLGMSPFAFAWHGIIAKVPWLLRFLPRSVTAQYYYLLGVKDVWTSNGLPSSG